MRTTISVGAEVVAAISRVRAVMSARRGHTPSVSAVVSEMVAMGAHAYLSRPDVVAFIAENTPPSS